MPKQAKTFKQEVVNTHQQLVGWPGILQKRPVAIVVSHSVGRSTYVNGWYVYSPWERTDPDAPWYAYGKKSFNDFQGEGDGWREKRKDALRQAMEWANEKYGPFNWVRNRMGDYVPKELNDAFPIRKG